jgi:hypothetical protein
MTGEQAAGQAEQRQVTWWRLAYKAAACSIDDICHISRQKASQHHSQNLAQVLPAGHRHTHKLITCYAPLEGMVQYTPHRNSTTVLNN